jgi:hypothetical protein
LLNLEDRPVFNEILGASIFHSPQESLIFAAFLNDLREQDTSWGQFFNAPREVREGHLHDAATRLGSTMGVLTVMATLRRAVAFFDDRNRLGRGELPGD